MKLLKAIVIAVVLFLLIAATTSVTIYIVELLPFLWKIILLCAILFLFLVYMAYTTLKDEEDEQ